MLAMFLGMKGNILEEICISDALKEYLRNRFVSSENVNDNNKREKRTRNRPCKAEKFSKDREKLVKELINKYQYTVG